MQTKTKLGLFAIVAIGLASVAAAPSLIGNASAKITPGETTPPTCTNHNGDVIGTSCPGSSAGPGNGHTFTPGTHTCNSNPQQKCPPGQNPP
jgi:hypothetical protein